MIKETDLCTSCMQIITNPICPYCFSWHIVNWLRDNGATNEELSIIIDDLNRLAIEYEEPLSETRCIICGEQNVNLCTYCFTSKSLLILEKYFNNDTIELFNEDFDTTIWRFDYKPEI